jgi:hypothetical protein
MTPSAPLGPDDTSIFFERGVQIRVRPSVAVRRGVLLGNLPFYYLSLFDDEIDARLDGFLSTSGALSAMPLARNAFALEPTDAVVVVERDNLIQVWRGGAANFPLYWMCTKGSIVLNTKLPIGSTRRLSISGLLASVAVASIAGQNEPNLSIRTPLADWFRCRRGAITHLGAGVGCLSENVVDFASADVVALDHEQLVESLRSAASAFGKRQAAIRSRAVIELSGGYDSTIAAIGVRNHGMDLVGISESFPYYEFRFEDGIQKAVADSLGISRIRIDGTRQFGYVPSSSLPKFDEPAMGALRIKRALAVARAAANLGIDRIFVGHGGDQLFAEELLDRQLTHPLDPEAFSELAWRQVNRAVKNAYYDPLMRKSTLTFSYDARFDVAFKEAFAITTRSPYTDTEWIRCGMAWARLPWRHSAGSSKQILADAFADTLPGAVIHRRGKVPWDGVSARGYAAHADGIVSELDRVGSLLEHLGLNMRWLNRRVRQLADLSKPTHDRYDIEVVASYALASWLQSWDILCMSDCEWSE